MRKLLATLVALLLVSGGGVWCAYSADNAQPASGPAGGTKAASGKKVRAIGTVEPREMVDVCAQVAGKIVSLGADPHNPGKSIDYNSSVEAGTVLAQIDSDLYAARVQRERASCTRAEAELAKATIHLQRAEFERKRAQYQAKSAVISETESELARFSYQAAKASVTVAAAALAQNQAALRQAEIELSYTTIKSPIQGVVIDRRVNVGQVVAPANGAAMFLVAKLDKLVVWASVNEADIAQIHRQQPVRFTVDAFPGKVFEGKVEQIRLNATMTQNVVTYTVVVGISSGTEELLPYMTASLVFQ
jgi:HlyD family secretion protein